MHEAAVATADTAKTAKTAHTERPYHKETAGGHCLEVCITTKDLQERPAQPHFVLRVDRQGHAALLEHHLRPFQDSTSDIPRLCDKRRLRVLLKEIRKNLRVH